MEVVEVEGKNNGSSMDDMVNHRLDIDISTLPFKLEHINHICQCRNTKYHMWCY